MTINGHSTSRQSLDKPKKPYPDFPLGWHGSGYWVKRIRGKLHYFGSRYAEPQVALDEYLRVRDDLQSGREPRTKTDGLTIRDVANRFMTDRQHRLDAGELARITFDEYHASCERMLVVFGKTRLVEDLRPDDFLAFRDDVAKVWGPVRLGNEVQRVRTIFKFAYESGLVDQPLRFGPTFVRPSKKVMRIQRATKGVRMFEPAQIHQMLAVASDQMKAMILLGLNAGYGNGDCASLCADVITGCWVDYPRPKTGIARRCCLWPETLDAIQAVVASRTPPKQSQHGRLLFLRDGVPWVAYRRDFITSEFRRSLIRLGIYLPGRSFYTLRHCCETIGGEAKDQTALNLIMGHADASMAAAYRERIDDVRLRAVSEHVRTWLFGSGKEADHGR